MIREFIIVVGGVCLVAMTLLADNKTGQTNIGQFNTNGAMSIVMRDRSHAQLEYVLFVDGTNIVMQEAIFPNFDKRRFWNSVVDKESAHMINVLINNGNPLKPPYVPPGPMYHRRVYDKWHLVSEDHFSRDDTFAQHLKELIGFLKMKQTPTTNAPTILSSNAELKRQFGF